MLLGTNGPRTHLRRDGKCRFPTMARVWVTWMLLISIFLWLVHWWILAWRKVVPEIINHSYFIPRIVFEEQVWGVLTSPVHKPLLVVLDQNIVHVSTRSNRWISREHTNSHKYSTDSLIRSVRTHFQYSDVHGWSYISIGQLYVDHVHLFRDSTS